MIIVQGGGREIGGRGLSRPVVVVVEFSEVKNGVSKGRVYRHALVFGNGAVSRCLSEPFDRTANQTTR